MPLKNKIVDLLSFVLGTGRNDSWLLGILVSLLSVSLYISVRNSEKTFVENIHIQSAGLLTVSFILTCLTPFPILPHYIFGVVTLLLLTIITMRPVPLFIVCICLLSRWGNFGMYQVFTRLPRRTVAQLEACAQKVCRSEKETLFVSLQAWHSYHFAPDHLFFLNKNGCRARDITQDPGFANKMAVVVDQSSYEHGKTAYNELTLFGTATVSATYSCEGNIQYFILKK